MMRYQYLPNTNKEHADIVILPVAFGESVSAKEGTYKAPQAILEASNHIEYYEEEMDYSPMQYATICVDETVSNYEKIATSVVTLNKHDQLRIFLGGDHSVTPQITSSLLKQPGTIVFFDAHADLRASYLNNPFSHATAAHHLLEQGHKIIYIGLRSYFETEIERIRTDKNITHFSAFDLQNPTKAQELFLILEQLKDDVYVSIDMDAFDPSFVPGVGTPQPGGIDYYFALKALKKIIFNPDINFKGIDFVELIPDNFNISQTFAAKLIQKTISYWGKRNGIDKREKKGAQMQVEYE